MSRYSHEPSCPVEAMFRILMGPWTMYILWTLRQDGPTRFGALKRKLDGISSKVLTERLRMLEGECLIFREHKATIPPEVTYGLTKHGEELGGALDALEGVARRWQEGNSETARRPVPPRLADEIVQRQS